MAANQKQTTQKTSAGGKSKKVSTGAKAKKVSTRVKINYHNEIVLMVTLMISVLLILSHFNLSGKAGAAIKGFTFGVFGFLSYSIPYLLFIGVAFFISNRGNWNAYRKLISGIGLLISAAGFLELTINDYTKGTRLLIYYKDSLESKNGGGLLGGMVCNLLCPFFGIVGTYVVILAVIAILLMFITEKLLFASLGTKSKQTMQTMKEKRQQQSEERKAVLLANGDVTDELKKRKRIRPITISGATEESKDSEVKSGVKEQDRESEPRNEKVLEFPKRGKKKTPAYDMEEVTPLSFDDIPIFRGDRPLSFASDELIATAEPAANTVQEQKASRRTKADEKEEQLLREQQITEDKKAEEALAFVENSSENAKQEADESHSEYENVEQEADASHSGYESAKQKADASHSGYETVEQEVDASHSGYENVEQKTDEVPSGYETSNGSKRSDENQNLSKRQCAEGNQNIGKRQSPEENQNIGNRQSAEENQNIGNRQCAEGNQNIGNRQSPEENQNIGNRGSANGSQNIENRQEESSLDIPVVNAIPEKEYVFPPISMLSLPKKNTKGMSDKELKETAIKLKTTLDSFGVRVTVTNVSCGPAVTRYELQPEQGVKVSRITGLADDIKLNLAAADIRIEAPIPGKAAVGIEVPNKTNTAVHLRELLETDEFRDHPSSIAFAVGKDIAGNTIVTDIGKMPHLLIAGATGSGKSVCINTLIMSILYKANPNDVKLIMVDPKVVELSVYNGIPHLLIPVVTDPKKASAALNWAVSEMTTRYNRFAEIGVRDMKGYNEKIKTVEAYQDERYQKMPQIVIIVDELADLMMVAPGEVEDAICRLAQMARAAGLHLIIATQRPSVNVITGLIKANVPSRIAFSVSSAIDSRTIIDGSGAEKLLGKGDMLFFPSGYPKPIRVQGAFVTDEEVSSIVEFLSVQNEGPQNSSEIENQINSVQSAADSGTGAAASGSTQDEYFIEAGKFIIEKDKASIGMLQRVYKIGFNRAARIVDQLAEAGVVGQEEGTKPRKVLMSLEEFEQYIEEYV